MSQDSKELLSAMHGQVLVLSINRPTSYNSWTSDIRDVLKDMLNAAENDDAVEAVVLTGEGTRAFCSGQYLPELQEFTDGRYIDQWIERLTACYDAVRQFSKPLVAAINGVAAGSGFQVTQFCDYVVAHPEVRVGQTEVNSGLPSVFGTWLMWQRVGSRSIELSLRGRLLSAREARELGFIHEIVEPAEVLQTALDAARRLAAVPKAAYRLSKVASRQLDRQGYRQAMEMARSFYKEAFDSGAPQKEIERFFETRRARKLAASAI